MCAVALTGARAIGYYSAGTFEFLLGRDQSFYFLEMNTRLQVEHPITELVTGVDLVKEMVQVADGAPLSFLSAERRGVAAGPFVRDDSGVVSGSWVSPEFDPLLSKLCVWAPTRPEALRRLGRALAEYSVLGVATNLDFLTALLAHPRVVSGDYDTTFVEQHAQELLSSPGDGQQQARDALLLAALAADADRSTSPAAPASASRWRDAVMASSTRFR
jgi:acetyl-CoA carboxylase biotin carboxylase subunit